MRLALALFLAGCAGPLPVDETPEIPDAQPPQAQAAVDPWGPQATLPDGPAADPDEQGVEDPDEDPLDPDPVDTGAWDAAPPELPVGSVLMTTLVCGLIEGTAAKSFELQGDGTWRERWMDGAEAIFLDELGPCMLQSEEQSPFDKTLRWWGEPEPGIYFESGGFGHDLWPSMTEDLWAGEVAPLRDPGPLCDEALDSLGLSWPVALALQIDAIVLPDDR